MSVIKKTYDMLADLTISGLLSIILIIGLFVCLTPFSDSASKGMTYINNSYFFFLAEHVVLSLILVIGSMIFITPRLCRVFLMNNEMN